MQQKKLKKIFLEKIKKVLTIKIDYDIMNIPSEKTLGKPNEREMIKMAEIKKLTKKEKFGMVLDYIQDNEMLVDFINNEINLLTKKASSTSKTKNQVENEAIKEKIVATLIEIAKPVTITEMQKSNEDMAIHSNQKLSALLTQLVNDNKVIRVVDKKKTYFSVEVA